MTARAPRRTQMTMKEDGGKPPAPKGAREQKLAAALRANLRRRKAAAPPAPKATKRER